MPQKEHLSNVEQDTRPNQPVSSSVDFEEEIDLTRYVRPVLRRWPLVAVISTMGALTGLFISGRRPVVYEASTTVLVQQATSPAALATARALLQNHTIAAETLQEVGLAGEPHHWTAQRFVDGALSVEEVGGTHLLRVKVRLADPEMAARVSHLLSVKAVDLNRQVATEGNTSVRGQLKVLLDEAAADLERAEEELLAERARAQVDVLRKDTEVMLESRGDYQQLLIDLEAEKSRLAAAEQELKGHEPLLAFDRLPGAEEALRRAGRSTPVASRSDAQKSDTSKSDASKSEEPRPAEPGSARGKPGQVPQTVRPEPVQPADPEFLNLSDPRINPVYQTLAFQIATSRALVAGMERRRRDLAALHGTSARQLKPLTELYRREIEVARLENRHELAERMYSELSLRYEQSRTESVGNMAHLQIVDPAVPPETPVNRRRLESLIAGLAAGFLLAALLALALGRDPRSDDGR